MKCPYCGKEDEDVIDAVEDVSLDGGWALVDLICRVHCYDCGKEYNAVYMARVIDDTGRSM